MKHLLEAINRGILRGLTENNIELLADLDDVNLGQLDAIQTKSINDKIDCYTLSIKTQLIDAIQTGEISDGLKQLINDPNNFNKLKGLIKANDKEHLKDLIWIGQKLFGDDGNFNWIDTSEITDMSKLFYENKRFNGHIELWDVSNVTNMHHMFMRCHCFNKPLNDWDVSKVRNMSGMFDMAVEFNQPLNNWKLSSVIVIVDMFHSAYQFKQDLSSWDVRHITVSQRRGMFTLSKMTQKYLPKFK